MTRRAGSWNLTYPSSLAYLTYLTLLSACGGPPPPADLALPDRPGFTQPAPPPAVPLNPASVASVLALETRDAAELPRLHSLLVNWHGEMVLERYYNGRTAQSYANIKSASKSVLSTLVGQAIARGDLAGVDVPIGAFFPDELAGPDNADRRAITIADLLTMQSGLETTSNQNYGTWVSSRNWVRAALAQPLIRAPGTAMIYSTGSTHLLSAILTKATGMSTWQFAQEVLAGPMGISVPPWLRDPQGIYFGGNDMLMRPRDLMRYGLTYLHGGVLDGHQVVPAEWVAASLTPRTVSPRGRGQRSYGYGWWMERIGGYPAYFAWGYGGQYAYLFPDLDLVVVTTSAATVGDGRQSHRRSLEQIVEQSIVGTIAALTGIPPPGALD